MPRARTRASYPLTSGLPSFQCRRIVRLELGQQDPSLSTLATLAKAVEVTVAELVG
jgi:hypothetical protein